MENAPMLGLARKLGFPIKTDTDPDDPSVMIVAIQLAGITQMAYISGMLTGIVMGRETTCIEPTGRWPTMCIRKYRPGGIDGAPPIFAAPQKHRSRS
jgi:hypothetical protein